MPQHPTFIRVPRPCAETWDDMTPTATGRHCAACQKTVIDFSQKTDAEILAVLAKAVGGETCGRFGADQLNRPLLPQVGGAPRPRWQAWVAVALAAWGLRAGPAEAAGRALAAPSTLHPTKKAGPAHPLARPGSRRLRGVIRDATTHQAIAGVAVFLKGENRMATTNSQGHFSLLLPAQRVRSRHTLVMHRTGYQSKTVHILAAAATPLVRAELHDEVNEAVVIAPFRPVQRQLVGGAVSTVVGAEIPTAPAPPPRGSRVGSFFRWLTKPFHKEQKLAD
jgi:hypothetical protein